MIWSSGSITKMHWLIELEMQETINMNLINGIHDGELAGGIKFDKEASHARLLVGDAG
jgi:hypothetical protein